MRVCAFWFQTRIRYAAQGGCRLDTAPSWGIEQQVSENLSRSMPVVRLPPPNVFPRFFFCIKSHDNFRFVVLSSFFFFNLLELPFFFFPSCHGKGEGASVFFLRGKLCSLSLVFLIRRANIFERMTWPPPHLSFFLPLVKN